MKIGYFSFEILFELACGYRKGVTEEIMVYNIRLPCAVPLLQ
jgi:hypothetical protein